MLVFFSLAPNTRDLDVFLRKQESGFGFRVLGGDGPDQPVSEAAHSYLIVLLLEWFYPVILISHHPIQAVQWWQNWSICYLPFRDQELVLPSFFPLFVGSSLQGSVPFPLPSPSLAVVFCQAEDTGGVSTAVAVSCSPRKGCAGAQPLLIVTWSQWWPWHRVCPDSVVGVRCTVAHPGKQGSGRKQLLLLSKFHKAVPFLAAQWNEVWDGDTPLLFSASSHWIFTYALHWRQLG